MVTTFQDKVKPRIKYGLNLACMSSIWMNGIIGSACSCIMVSYSGITTETIVDNSDAGGIWLEYGK